MALNDCEKCLEAPCVCGHEYMKWPTNKLEDLIRVLETERLSRFTLDVVETRKVLKLDARAKLYGSFTVELQEHSTLRYIASWKGRMPFDLVVKVRGPWTLSWMDGVEWVTDSPPPLINNTDMFFSCYPYKAGWKVFLHAVSDAILPLES